MASGCSATFVPGPLTFVNHKQGIITNPLLFLHPYPYLNCRMLQIATISTQLLFEQSKI